MKTDDRQAIIHLAHDALQFADRISPDWPEEKQIRHLREQIALARKHLESEPDEAMTQLLADKAELQKDKARIDALEANCWDVRYRGDACEDVAIEIIGHFMTEPWERVVGENYREDLRAAIDQAMTADAYPPARPEYDDEAMESDDEA